MSNLGEGGGSGISSIRVSSLLVMASLLLLDAVLPMLPLLLDSVSSATASCVVMVAAAMVVVAFVAVEEAKGQLRETASFATTRVADGETTAVLLVAAMVA